MKSSLAGFSLQALTLTKVFKYVTPSLLMWMKTYFMKHFQLVGNKEKGLNDDNMNDFPNNFLTIDS